MSFQVIIKTFDIRDTARVLGIAKNTVSSHLKKALEVQQANPCVSEPGLSVEIARFFTDDWGSHSKLIPPDKHSAGKRPTRKIENKNLLFRARIKCLARKTICFSTSETMLDTVIGLFINRYFFN